jgi:hypothetical protein
LTAELAIRWLQAIPIMFITVFASSKPWNISIISCHLMVQGTVKRDTKLYQGSETGTSVPKLLPENSYIEED